MNYFKEYFVCPECNKPVRTKVELKECVEKHNFKFCTQCGKNIATAYQEAAATLREST